MELEESVKVQRVAEKERMVHPGFHRGQEEIKAGECQQTESKWRNQESTGSKGMWKPEGN